jgi:hypothetical protein
MRYRGRSAGVAQSNTAYGAGPELHASIPLRYLAFSKLDESAYSSTSMFICASVIYRVTVATTVLMSLSDLHKRSQRQKSLNRVGASSVYGMLNQPMASQP